MNNTDYSKSTPAENINYIVNTLTHRLKFVLNKNYSNVTFYLKGNKQDTEQALAANKKLSDCFDSFISKYNSFILNDDTVPIKKLSSKEIDSLTFIFNKEQDLIIEVMKDFNKLGKFPKFNENINSQLNYNTQCFEALLNIFDVD